MCKFTYVFFCNHMQYKYMDNTRKKYIKIQFTSQASVKLFSTFFFAE